MNGGRYGQQGYLDLALDRAMGLQGSNLWRPPHYIIIKPMWINGSVSKVASEAA
jgi:hypothetical protein